MSAPVPMPTRPAVPPRPTVPVSAPRAVVNPNPVVPTTIEEGKTTIESFVAPAVVPVSPNPVVPATVGTPPAPIVIIPDGAAVALDAATTMETPKKRGRQKGVAVVKTTTPWHGLYMRTADGSDYVYDLVQTDAGQVQQARKAKLQGVPALETVVTIDGVPTSDGGFNPETHDRLRPREFAKPGDYYRWELVLLERRKAELELQAKNADAGKLRTNKRAEAEAAERKKLLELVKTKFTPEQIAAFGISLT